MNEFYKKLYNLPDIVFYKILIYYIEILSKYKSNLLCDIKNFKLNSLKSKYYYGYLNDIYSDDVYSGGYYTGTDSDDSYRGIYDSDDEYKNYNCSITDYDIKEAYDYECGYYTE